MTAGWIGFASIAVGCFGSVGMSLVVDRFKRKMKMLLVLMNIGSIALYAVIVCVQGKYVYVPPQYVTGE